MSLECFQYVLMNLEHVSAYFQISGFIATSNLHQFAHVSSALVLTLNHRDFFSRFPSVMIVITTVKFAVLLISFETVVLAILGAVHLDEGCSVATVVAGVVTCAELVEFENDIVQLVAICTECDGEFFLLLTQENQHAEETWDHVVATLTEQLVCHLFVVVSACTSLLLVLIII